MGLGMRLYVLGSLVSLAVAGRAGAQTRIGSDDESDAAALSLPGAPADAAAKSGFSSLTVEGDAAAAQTSGGESETERVSLDARYDAALAAGLRAVLAERLDTAWSQNPAASAAVGTLKEAYVSWQPDANVVLDGGRINGRQGVAFGYNPTDYFRADAVRSVVSLDPNSLRDNRLGTVMARGEVLWDSGALTVLYAPRLTQHTSTAALAPDWGATNATGRWLVSVSQRLAAKWTPQWLVFGADGHPTQVGLNTTGLIGQSTIVYAEVSSGRATSLYAQALDQPQTSTWRARAATGLTYTATNKLSLTVEYEYNGAGLSAQRWSGVQRGDPADYGRYREYLDQQQDLPTRSNLFLYASWADVLIRHWDLTAFWRLDLADHSRLPYVEVRHHWVAFDLALRWQDAAGTTTSDYGADTERQTWQLLVDYYL